MTLHNGADNAPSTAPPETKAEKPVETKKIPESRIKSDPKLWEEAMELANMLTFCRPNQSKTERKFIAKYLVPLGVHFDKYGNIYKQIGNDPIVLWSCHTDTVHSMHGPQKIVYWSNKNTGDIHFCVDQTQKGRKSSCLGADDTCGIWLMTQMIRNNIPGLYIFHRAEEVGGKGSGWIAEHNKFAVKGIRFAIAFDRRGEKSIITHQRSKRCCSDEFAASLAEQLGMGHKCDTGGSFTDTASYVDLIAECTNVSVGYDGAHTSNEDTNVDYLFRLRDALLKMDVSKLVEKRKAGENTPLYTSYNYSGGNSYGAYEGWDNWCEPTDAQLVAARARGGLTGMECRKLHTDKHSSWMDHYEFDKWYFLWFPKKKKSDLGVTKVWRGNQSVIKPTYREVIKMIKENPEVIADLLETVGYGPSEIRAHLIDVGTLGNNVLL